MNRIFPFPGTEHKCSFSSDKRLCHHDDKGSVLDGWTFLSHE